MDYVRAVLITLLIMLALIIPVTWLSEQLTLRAEERFMQNEIRVVEIYNQGGIVCLIHTGRPDSLQCVNTLEHQP